MGLSLKKITVFLFLAFCIGSAGFVAASGSTDLTTTQVSMSEVPGLEIDESEKDNPQSDVSHVSSHQLPHSQQAASLPRFELSQLLLLIHYQSGIRAPPPAL